MKFEGDSGVELKEAKLLLVYQMLSFHLPSTGILDLETFWKLNIW